MSFLVIIISLIIFVILMGKCSFRYTTGCQGDFYLMAEGMQQNIYSLFDCGTKNIMLLLPLECAQKLLFLHSRVEKIIQIMKKKNAIPSCDIHTSMVMERNRMLHHPFLKSH